MNPEQVQGTNDSSIVSKLSMVRMGYFEDSFIEHFVAKPSRRSPLINRCYFARATAVSYLVNKFLEASSSPRQIVSLGAGFDTKYFRLREVGLTDNLYYVEVDFRDVMKRKITLAKRGNLLSDREESDEAEMAKHRSVVYQSHGYTAVGYDLRTVGAEFRDLLCSIGFDLEKPTLLFSEVVLTYLPPKKSSRVLEWIAKDFSNAVVVVFEQVSPNDSFGQVMCKHFKQIGSPLMAISDYPTIASHIARHRRFGFKQSSAISLDRLFSHRCMEENYKHMRGIETFDEFEAWHRACQHYFILCSTNSEDTTLRSFAKSVVQDSTYVGRPLPPPTSIRVIECEGRMKGPFLQRYGHCSCLITFCDREFVAVFGGFGALNSNSSHQRLTDNVCLLNTTSGSLHRCESEHPSKNSMQFPMFGSAVTTSQGTVLLFGGRAAPLKSTNSVATVTFSSNASQDSKWSYSARVVLNSAGATWPDPRWRHCAVCMRSSSGKDFMIVSGGRNSSKVFDEMWCYDVACYAWTLVDLHGEKISPRHSHSMCVKTDSNSILLTGGLSETEVPSSDVFQITFLDVDFINAHVTRISNCSLPPIYSHTSHCVDEEVFLVGGVTAFVDSEYGDEGPVDAVRAINLVTGESTSYGFADGAGLPIMLHNHSSVISATKNELFILGGGDNCFSFGTWFNRSPYILKLDNIRNSSD